MSEKLSEFNNASLKNTKINSDQLHNYILHKDFLISLEFANIKKIDNNQVIEKKIINHFLKEQEKIINLFEREKIYCCI